MKIRTFTKYDQLAWANNSIERLSDDNKLLRSQVLELRTMYVTLNSEGK